MSQQHDIETANYSKVLRYLEIIDFGLTGNTSAPHPSTMDGVMEAFSLMAPSMTTPMVFHVMADTKLLYPELEYSEEENEKLMELSVCDCGRNMDEKSRCFSCEKRTCKSCCYSLLDACTRIDEPENNDESHMHARHRSLAAKRVRFPCEECSTDIQLDDGYCECDDVLFGQHHGWDFGAYCKECMPGVMDDMARPNTTEDGFQIVQERGARLYDEYTCDCGEPRREGVQLGPYCKLCWKLCQPYNLAVDTDSEDEEEPDKEYCPYFIEYEEFDHDTPKTVAEFEQEADEKWAQEEARLEREAAAARIRKPDCRCAFCRWSVGNECRGNFPY
ncbi:uncharacterized protein LY89DRAFT_675266 [Mollisia scopiformis]|uniref:Uncharacterized protein n=1 Tax=Mollisia scopiformis TaxID=149040 RepID=A0A132BDD0_MOLSC|nr:uncharacterized protein LY89DRAFT_675266 [Mollisia scopiformis]KUJ10435.1 hypothetical protein LY89DRAFT_675266 [Mollisia scopiformis]